MTNKWAYKTVSLVTGVVGVLALIVIGLMFAGGRPDPVAAVPVGIIAIIALPIAYVTNKLGRH